MSLTHVSDALDADREGLGQLAAAIPAMESDINAALELIDGMDGRLIVTGLGKSGHIGAKLAATFASTGTPALRIMSRAPSTTSCAVSLGATMPARQSARCAAARMSRLRLSTCRKI